MFLVIAALFLVDPTYDFGIFTNGAIFLHFFKCCALHLKGYVGPEPVPINFPSSCVAAILDVNFFSGGKAIEILGRNGNPAAIKFPFTLAGER